MLPKIRMLLKIRMLPNQLDAHEAPEASETVVPGKRPMEVDSGVASCWAHLGIDLHRSPPGVNSFASFTSFGNIGSFAGIG